MKILVTFANRAVIARATFFIIECSNVPIGGDLQRRFFIRGPSIKLEYFEVIHTIYCSLPSLFRSENHYTSATSVGFRVLVEVRGNLLPVSVGFEETRQDNKARSR